MTAATQSMPFPNTNEAGQQLTAPPYNRLVKDEVLDPGYGSQAPCTPTAMAPNTPQPAINNSFPMAPAGKANRARKTNSGGAPKAKKVKTEPVPNNEPNTIPNGTAGASQSHIGDHMPVQKKKRDRFKGTTEEEVLTRVLPDHVRDDLDILIVGINPGLTAAYVQHHYAGPGNHFWKCLYLSGMIPEPMNALQDAELMNYGIGFTNIVARTTRGSADLTRKEIFEGGEILKEKMLKFLPRIALFNGKGIYEVFCGHKKFYFGLQPEPFPGCPNTVVFVNPSSSARCTQLPRAADKVAFYEALKRVRDHIRVHGSIDGIDRSTVTFPDFKLVTAPQKVKKEVKEEPKEQNGEHQMNQQLPATAINTNNLQRPETFVSASKVAPTKPRKPRGRPKKDKLAGTVDPSALSLPNDVLMAVSNQSAPASTAQQQMQHTYVNANSNMSMHQPNTLLTDMKQSLQHNSLHHPAADFNIKQEVLDGHHPDKDLAAIIQHSINAQSMFQQQQQQSLVTSNMMQHTMNGAANLHHGLIMPASAPSAVKQERSDWNGYGVMPAYTTAPPTSMATTTYPPYPCYWNYLPHPSNNSFMTNPYSSIPGPQIAHQQAVAAAAALHTSVNASQPNVIATSAPAVVSYSSPQEASSPAMSSQSNLTQASLDSLPKADSASTVANWLQTIPHST